MEIGPTIGKKLQEDAMIAVLISFVGIVLLHCGRGFELVVRGRGPLGNLSRCARGVRGLLCVGQGNYLLVVTALRRWPVSLTDTVVVFDRIRENLRTSSARR